jgi:hypothetical protein
MSYWQGVEKDRCRHSSSRSHECYRQKIGVWKRPISFHVVMVWKEVFGNDHCEVEFREGCARLPDSAIRIWYQPMSTRLITARTVGSADIEKWLNYTWHMHAGCESGQSLQHMQDMGWSNHLQLAENSYDATMEFSFSELLRCLLHSSLTFIFAIYKGSTDRSASSAAVLHSIFPLTCTFPLLSSKRNSQDSQPCAPGHTTTRYGPSAKRSTMPKRKAEQEGWQDNEKHIRDLYITENLTLDKVMDAMRKRGFDKTYTPTLSPVGSPVGSPINIRIVGHSTRNSSEHGTSPRKSKPRTGKTLAGK